MVQRILSVQIAGTPLCIGEWSLLYLLHKKSGRDKERSPSTVALRYPVLLSIGRMRVSERKTPFLAKVSKFKSSKSYAFFCFFFLNGGALGDQTGAVKVKVWLANTLRVMRTVFYNPSFLPDDNCSGRLRYELNGLKNMMNVTVLRLTETWLSFWTQSGNVCLHVLSGIKKWFVHDFIDESYCFKMKL